MAQKRPPPVIQERLRRCRQLMHRHSLGAYLVTARADQIYLTGFDGEDGAALITAGGVTLVTDGRFGEVLNRQAPWADVVLRRGPLEDAVAQAIRSRRPRTVGVQANRLPLQLYQSLQQRCRPIRLTAAPPLVDGLRLTKDPTELRKIRKAIRIAEAAFAATRGEIRVGMTESEVAACLEYEMKRRGASGPSFETIVAEGPNAALPHARPGKRCIKDGSLLLIDWGAVCDHYCSDLTRVLFVGKIRPRLKRLYQIVLEAQEKALAAIAPGKRVCDIDKAARDHITAAGYGPAFIHGLGHGIGLDIHEEPRLKYGLQDRLEVGMVVTVEPGIYIAGSAGIRIEDDVLVTARGHQILTGVPKAAADCLI